jgi:hypothetical protein
MGAQVQLDQPVQVVAALAVQVQVEAKKVQQDQLDQVEVKKEQRVILAPQERQVL